MINVNKEMSWYGVTDLYRGECLFINVIEENDTQLIRVYVYCVIENIYDNAVVRDMGKSRIEGIRTWVPYTDKVLKEHPELAVFEVF